MAVNCSSGPTLSIFVVTSIHSAMYRRESAVRTAVHKVHSGLFVRKLDMTYMILHHNSWESVPARSGIWQESAACSADHVCPHSGRIFWGESMVCTVDHGVHSPVTVSTFCSQHQTLWLGIFLSFVLCILFLTATQCWCTIQMW